MQSRGIPKICTAGWFSIGLAFSVFTVSIARGDEDEFVLIVEPTSFMQVADAFDEHDLFDPHAPERHHPRRAASDDAIIRG